MRVGQEKFSQDCAKARTPIYFIFKCLCADPLKGMFGADTKRLSFGPNSNRHFFWSFRVYRHQTSKTLSVPNQHLRFGISHLVVV